MDWRGVSVLITGASSGIGEATAYELAARGARLILVARRKHELERVAKTIAAASGAECHCIAADVTEHADRLRVRDYVTKHLGSLNMLVNNAGITAHGRFDETRLPVLRKIMEINFFASVELTSELIPLIKKAAGPRRILLVSTPSGLYGVPGRFAYSASKAAGHVVMDVLRVELRDENIHTVIFCPGYVRTNLRTSGLAADGGVLADEQASGARTPEEIAVKLRKALEGRQRVVVTNGLGRIVYWLRTLAPGLLEWLMAKKLKKDFQKSAH